MTSEDNISGDEMEDLSRQLQADGVGEGKARKWATEFREWYLSFRKGELKLAPREYAEFWIDTIFFPAGYGTTVFAKPGEGKTNLVSYLIQSALVLRPRWIFLHTVPFPDVIKKHLDDRLIEITTARQMMREIIDVIRKGNIPVLCLDEWDSVYNAVNVNSRQGKSWSSFVWRQRHFSVRGPLMIYHAVNSIPKAIRNRTMAGELLWIEGWKNERYVSNPDLTQYMMIPRASIPYLSKGNTGFEIDLDFSILLNKVSGSQEEVLDQIEEELEKSRGFEDEREAFKQKKKEMKQQIIAKGLELRNESLTNPQIADELRSLFPEADFITPEWVRRNVPSKGARDKN